MGTLPLWIRKLSRNKQSRRKKIRMRTRTRKMMVEEGGSEILSSAGGAVKIHQSYLQYFARAIHLYFRPHIDLRSDRAMGAKTYNSSFNNLAISFFDGHFFSF